MQTEKRSKAVQGIELTKEQMNEQFNIATKELFSWFSYDEIKPSIDNLLLGWIGSDLFELEKKPERVTTLDFFNKLLLYFQKIDSEYISIADSKEIKIEWFNEFLTSNFDHNYKDIKKYFKLTLRCFLEDDISDDNLLRNDVIYRVEFLQKYFKKIYKIKQKAN